MKGELTMKRNLFVKLMLLSLMMSVSSISAQINPKASSEKANLPFRQWLFEYIPAHYSDARMTDHHHWLQANIGEDLIVSWTQWNEKNVTLKYMESHALTNGKVIFIEKAVKTDWVDNAAVTYIEGAGYYCSGYDSATMSGWCVEGCNVVQFDGDAKRFVEKMAKVWAGAQKTGAKLTSKASVQEKEPVASTSAVPQKLRVIMMSDFPPIGVVKGGNVPNNQKSDPDDMQSMVRFLLYANEFDIEGLVAAAGTFAMEAHKKNMLEVLDRYEMVYGNLKSHDPAYPTADYLRSVTYEGLGNNHGLSIKWGSKTQPVNDIIGEGKDSEASNAIIAAADKPDPRPLWIGVWGTPREVSQAIWRVRKDRSEEEFKAFISKLRVFLIAYQDCTHGWLMKEFPDLFIIDSRKTYQGMFGGRDPISNLAWVNENIRNNHGPLCDIYPHEGMGCTGVCEGDSPTFMHLVSANRGINNPEDPTQGGWGGQYKRKANTNHYVDGPGGSSISRWRKDYQKEFAERADWCVGHITGLGGATTESGSTTRKPAIAAGNRRDGWSRIVAASFDSTGGSIEASGENLYYVKPNAWVQYNNVDLHTGTKTVQMNVANGGGDTTIQVWVGGTKVGALTVTSTGGWNDYQTQSITLDAAQSGVQNVKLVFVNGNVNMDWLIFSASLKTTPSRLPEPTVDSPPKTTFKPKKTRMPKGYRPRIINTTDLGADPDDEQSMVRFLVCSNEFDAEGLIVATGCWKKNQSSTGMLDKLVNAYDQVYENLKMHADGYPTPEYLRSISVMGQRGYGMGDVGAGKDSPGSEMIIAAVDKDDPRPVWVGGWGGVNNVAQAVWKVQNTRSAAELAKFISKLRVFDILGQDDAGAWLAKNFPDLFYIRATGVYGWQPSKNDPYLREHIQSHGPLGKVYPNTKWATEGDTPAFMHVYPNGLNDPEQIDQGGWGGRFDWNKKKNIRSMSGVKTESRFAPYYMYGNTSEKAGAIKRWSKGYNNDFAARMDWTMTDDYSKANHHPVAIVNGDATRQILEVSASPGSSIALSAAGSSDPDNNSLTYKWSYYNEPCSYSGSVNIQNSTSASATVAIPSNAGGKTIHIILELHDNGSPNLYAYRRVIISVQ